MNIVLVSSGNFQEYILTNIDQLLKLQHNSIFVLTNRIFFDKFIHYPKDKVKLISIEELDDIFNYTDKSTMTRDFRGGFWYHTSARFFYIYAFMEKYNISNVVHLENDVLLYYNCDEMLADKFNQNHIYIPFSSYDRSVISIMYIPTSNLLKQILKHYNCAKNDMQNFAKIQKQTNIIDNFPICITDTTKNEEYQFITRNFDTFQFIFDAAAIGQYIGGVDPRNIEGDTTGFVNEHCAIRYDIFDISWKKDNINSVKKPFIKINDTEYRIFNLHIHSKNLEQWSGEE